VSNAAVCYGTYDSVKRFVGRVRAETPLRLQRMESAVGEEAQVGLRGVAVVPSASAADVDAG
jgi:hypothetical protein